MGLVVASGVLWVAVGVLWVRSHRVGDFWFWNHQDEGPTRWTMSVRSMAGEVGVFRQDDRWLSPPPWVRLNPGRHVTEELEGPLSAGLADPGARWERFFGFAMKWWEVSRWRDVQVTTTYVVVPYWFLAMVTGAGPGVVLMKKAGKWRLARRMRSGFCVGCGYDLRGTPERCPECGRVAGV
jgi:hypothetical protein